MEFRVFYLFFSSEPLSDSFGMLERHFEWGRTGKLLSKTEVSRLPVDLLIDRLIACEIMMVRNWQELWQCSLCCLLKCITAIHLSCNEFDRQIQFSILKCCEHSGLSLVDESQKPFSWSINQAFDENLNFESVTFVLMFASWLFQLFCLCYRLIMWSLRGKLSWIINKIMPHPPPLRWALTHWNSHPPVKRLPPIM